MERRRRMRCHVNLPDIPEHAQLQPVELFFHTSFQEELRATRKDKKTKSALFHGYHSPRKVNLFKSTKNHLQDQKKKKKKKIKGLKVLKVALMVRP